MIKRFSILVFTFVLMVALLGACGGGGSDDEKTTTPDSSETPVPTSAPDDAQIIENAETFFQNPPQFELDFDEEKAFDDFAVPNVNMDIPDIGMESLDFDLEFDPEVSVDDALTVPSAGSILGDLPGLPSTGSQETPPAEYVPTAADCARFAAAPSCAYVPSQYQDLCEQCRELGY